MIHIPSGEIVCYITDGNAHVCINCVCVYVQYLTGHTPVMKQDLLPKILTLLINQVKPATG